MRRSHLERDPAEFVELIIWASSRAHLDLKELSVTVTFKFRRLAYIFRTQVRASCGGLGPVVDPMLYQYARFRAGPEGWTP